ncbi:MAG: hypothetical protein M9953_13465 [Thermomicrobiales bacterium]|nr:hypothetical protein [Thermomicrobiales bacterium]MCO5229460.1 hypothetical protein [Thermomicrobiales bacterium]
MITPPPGRLLIRDELLMVMRFLAIEGNDARNILSLEFNNYLCMLVYEQSQYLHLNLPDSKLHGDFPIWLERGRNLTKDLRDGQSVTKSLSHFEKFLDDLRTAWKSLQDSRRFSRIFRYLQTDMGIYSVGTHYITNTTSISLHSSFSAEMAIDLERIESSEEMFRDFGVFLGRSTAIVANQLDLSNTISTFPPRIATPKVRDEDVHSAKSLARLSREWSGLSPGVGLFLLSILGRLRSWSLLAQLLQNNSSDLATAKLKYLAFWSTWSDLHKLINWAQLPSNRGLPVEIALKLKLALSSQPVTFLRRQSDLRNIFVHYGHRTNPHHQTGWITDRHQLVAQNSEFTTVPELHYACEAAIGVIDDSLDEVLRFFWKTHNWSVAHDRETKEIRRYGFRAHDSSIRYNRDCQF